MTYEEREKIIKDIASFDDSTLTDDEWNQKLLETAAVLDISVEDLLAEIESINEFNTWLEEDAEKEFWSESNNDICEPFG